MVKKKILVICPFPYDVAAGQRLKYEQYFQNWKEEGYDVEMSSFMSLDMWDVVYTKGNLAKKILGTLGGYYKRIKYLFSLSHFDLVYIFMWVTPFGSSLFERLYRFFSEKVIFDIEDNAMIDHSNSLNPVMSFLRGTSKIKFLVTKADQVITSSPFLNDICMDLNLNKSCTYISSSVDTKRFIPSNKYINNKVITVGWTGTFSSIEYLDQLREVFTKLASRVRFKLIIIGNFQYDLPGVDLEVIQWSKESEIVDLNLIDIGVYPLPQNDWIMGKSGLKAIQYMALGLPTVATNIGTTPRIITHMRNGWLVSTDEEWLAALENLILNPGLRKSLGEAARAKVLQNYSNQIIKQSYLSILNKHTS